MDLGQLLLNGVFLVSIGVLIFEMQQILSHISVNIEAFGPELVLIYLLIDLCIRSLRRVLVGLVQVLLVLR